MLLQNAGNPPTISAGPDAVVDEGAVYVLDSTVPIGNYTVVWSQVSGPQGVQLSYQSSGSDGGALIVSVPQIDGNDAPLQLKQWVRDNSNGRIATDFVTLTIHNSDGSQPPVTDSEPPVVSASHQTAKHKGTTYQTLTLASNEAATIYVRIVSGCSLTGASTPPVPSSTEPGWLEYQGSFELLMESRSGAVEYWARDTAGNASAVQQYGF